jgi:CheY-like chemotaxis protein
MARTMHILLVENNSTDQIAIQLLFQSQKLGYRLEFADTQAQALKWMKVFSY